MWIIKSCLAINVIISVILIHSKQEDQLVLQIPFGAKSIEILYNPMLTQPISLTTSLMPTLLSLAAQEIVVMINLGTSSDDKVGVITTIGFQWRPYASKVPTKTSP